MSTLFSVTHSARSQGSGHSRHLASDISTSDRQSDFYEGAMKVSVYSNDCGYFIAFKSESSFFFRGVEAEVSVMVTTDGTLTTQP
jgi:hypothetical protein